MPATTAVPMTLNQKTQYGLETTAGVDVACTKVFGSIDVTLGIQLDLNKKRAMGRRFPRLVAPGNEMVGWKYSGKPTFDEMLYLWANQFGNVSPTAQGTLGKKYTLIPAITGPQSPQPFSMQQGDGVTRNRKVNFAVATDHTLHISKSDNDISGSGISHPIQDNATLTSNPTMIAAQAISKPMWAFFNDATAINIGNTQAVMPLDIEFSYGGSYGPLYAINRSGQYANIVDLEPDAHFAVLFAVDSEGMGYLPGARAGTRQYQRLNAIGAMIENTWTVTLGGATGGTFTLSFNGQTTAAQPNNVSAATLQTALTGLSTVGAGNATVSGSAGGPYTVTFTSALVSTTLPLGFDGSLLTGRTAAMSNVPTAYLAQVDACTICTAVKEFADSDGVYAVGYNFDFFEDPSWTVGSANGTAAILTMINTLASL
jgi:hypothetical protein